MPVKQWLQTPTYLCICEKTEASICKYQQLNLNKSCSLWLNYGHITIFNNTVHFQTKYCQLFYIFYNYLFILSSG